jgi:hypothetical protein
MVSACTAEIFLASPACMRVTQLRGCVVAVSPRRYIVQSLPLILVGSVAVVLLCIRTVQLVQSRLLHMIPFGALTNWSSVNVGVGVVVSGSFMLYFGASCPACRSPHAREPRVRLFSRPQSSVGHFAVALYHPLTVTRLCAATATLATFSRWHES